MVKLVQLYISFRDVTLTSSSQTKLIKTCNFRHIVVKSEGSDYHFSIRNHNSVTRKTIGFSAPLRKWAVLSINQPIMVCLHVCLSIICLANDSPV